MANGRITLRARPTQRGPRGRNPAPGFARRRSDELRKYVGADESYFTLKHPELMAYLPEEPPSVVRLYISG